MFEYLKSHCIEIVAIISLLFTAYQFYRNRITNRIIRSVELSKYYEQEIINRLSAIIYQYEQENDIHDIIMSIDINRMVNFDYKEIRDILGDQKLKKLEEFDETSTINIISCLNKLEFFAMNFIEHAADEVTVYSSLHQTYLEIVRLLYYHICIQNKGDQSDYYYQNVKCLFKKWKNINRFWYNVRHVIRRRSFKA